MGGKYTRKSTSWPATFYGNYRPEVVPLLKQAAADTGFEIEVRDDARDIYGKPVEGRVAVHVLGKFRDRTPLWRRYLELKEEATDDQHR